TTQELATLREVALAYQPDLVLVGFYLNDVEPPIRGGNLPLETSETSIPRLIHNCARSHLLVYRALLQSIPRPGIDAYTMSLARSYNDDSPGWAEARSALLEIAAEARRHGSQMLIVVFPMMVSFDQYALASAHQTIVAFCEKHGLPVLDLLSTL